MGSLDPSKVYGTKGGTPSWKPVAESKVQTKVKPGPRFSRQEFLEKHAPRVAATRSEVKNNIHGSITLQVASCEALGLEMDLSLKDLTKELKMTK